MKKSSFKLKMFLGALIFVFAMFSASIGISAVTVDVSGTPIVTLPNDTLVSSDVVVGTATAWTAGTLYIQGTGLSTDTALNPGSRLKLTAPDGLQWCSGALGASTTEADVEGAFTNDILTGYQPGVWAGSALLPEVEKNTKGEITTVYIVAPATLPGNSSLTISLSKLRLVPTSDTAQAATKNTSKATMTVTVNDSTNHSKGEISCLDRPEIKTAKLISSSQVDVYFNVAINGTTGTYSKGLKLANLQLAATPTFAIYNGSNVRITSAAYADLDYNASTKTTGDKTLLHLYAPSGVNYQGGYGIRLAGTTMQEAGDPEIMNAYGAVYQKATNSQIYGISGTSPSLTGVSITAGQKKGVNSIGSTNGTERMLVTLTGGANTAVYLRVKNAQGVTVKACSNNEAAGTGVNLYSYDGSIIFGNSSQGAVMIKSGGTS
ncbi:MAG: hypothetical protein SV062_05030, partial [Thermodesulfobacteriota bacterium]|nr:hypothetical protein [Thermodesulfobacteriota bacterium]